MCSLMGLNDSFSQIQGQVLLLEPIPSINKVFSLVVQEERQREVGSAPISNDSFMAFAVRLAAPKPNSKGVQDSGSKYKSWKNQPTCSHCGTAERYFELHGYPPGSKRKLKLPSSAIIGQVSDTNSQTSGELSANSVSRSMSTTEPLSVQSTVFILFSYL